MRAWNLLFASLATFAGCGGRTCGSATTTPAPTLEVRAEAGADASSPIDASSAGPVAPPTSWAGKPETIAFSQDALFVVFQDETSALLVDLREGRRGARVSSRPYATSGSWTPLGLPMETTPTYPWLDTSWGGRLARLVGPGPDELENLLTGKRIPLPKDAQVFEDYVLVKTSGGVQSRLHEGRVFDLPFDLTPQDSGRVLVGPAKGEGKLAVADPRTGRVMELPIDPTAPVSVEWVAEDRSKVFVKSAHFAEDDTTSNRSALAIYAFPEAKALVSTTSRGLVIDHRVSTDDTTVAWVEATGKDEASVRCGAGMIAVEARSASTTPLFPCRREEFEKDIDLVLVESTRVVISVGALKTFDPRTGKAIAGPPPRPRRADEGIVDMKALAKELALVRKERPEIDQIAPLIREGAVLSKKHGYVVDGFGNARTVLVHRDRACSLCDARLGEPCRPSFELGDGEGDDVYAVFSSDGKKLAVVSESRLRVVDGVAGDVLFELARAPRPAQDAGAGARPRAPAPK